MESFQKRRRVSIRGVRRTSQPTRTRAVRRYYPKRTGKYRRSGFYGRFNGPRGIGRPELKFFDTSMASTAVDNTLEVQGNLNLIPQVGLLLLSAIKPVTLV